MPTANDHWRTFGNVTAPGFKDFRRQYHIGISVFADSYFSNNCVSDYTDVSGHYDISCEPKEDGGLEPQKRVCIYHRLYDKLCRGQCVESVTGIENINFKISKDDPVKEPYCYDEKYDE